MYDTLTPAAIKEMLVSIAQKIIDSTDMLTEVDQAIGDGDHGIGMRRGFTAVLEQMHESSLDTLEAVFKAAGMAIMSKAGGASGALFGTFFRYGSVSLAGHDFFDAKTAAMFLQQGLKGVEERSGSHPGQKTMIDALAPAAKAAADNTHSGLAETLRIAAEAAIKGVEETKNMIATTGKARTLGKRSLGHPDPGAVSISLILKAMSDFVAGGVEN